MRKRNVQILFRLASDEAQEFDKKVKKSGLHRETFLREMIAGFTLREKPDKDFYSVMKQLTAIGNNLNQLAAKAQSLNFIDSPELEKQSREWAELQSAVQEKYLLPKRRTDSGR